MTFEEWQARTYNGETITPSMAFEAGAASRDAEIADWRSQAHQSQSYAEQLEAEVKELIGMREEVLHYQREFHRSRDTIAKLVAALGTLAQACEDEGVRGMDNLITKCAAFAKVKK